MLASPVALLSSTAHPLFLPLTSLSRRRRFGFPVRCDLRPPLLISSSSSAPPAKSSVLLDTLRVLEWDKLCDHVASFASTALGQEAIKKVLWSLDVSYEESIHLLRETAAAVEMMKFGVGGMDFTGVDVILVRSAIERALRGFLITCEESIAVANIIQSSELLQVSLEAAVREDTDWYRRFMPLTEMIVNLPINHTFLNSVLDVMDGDGTIKDTASSEVKQFRDQLRLIERKLHLLLEKLVSLDTTGVSSSEITIKNGRWCLRVASDKFNKNDGLLLSSGTGFESLVEPLMVIPLNDELQQLRGLARKAEDEVLSQLTNKMLAEVDDIQRILDTVIELDVIIARAKYSTLYGGTYPDLLMPEGRRPVPHSKVPDSVNDVSKTSSQPQLSERKWKFYARGAYHPLLLQKYRSNLHQAKMNVKDAISLRRLELQGHDATSKDIIDSTIANLKMKVAQMEENHPVPVDFTISMKTNVVVITGPNTGGKTISLKTVGLAALMAKKGLYVIAAEPVQMPWFDAVFADIGDQQSLSQSLSTFSSHLKKISAIQLNSTERSLILLDEVGAGTNPLEGAALGMSLLESFGESGAFLTIATTHHGELKTLKYCNHLFENACMEFDDVNLKPTYRILWGVPGRSNAINIAERLGMPRSIIDAARNQYGTASAEINEIILDMETFKQDSEHQLQEAQEALRLAKKHHDNLKAAKCRIDNHALSLNARKFQAIMDIASFARSLLRSKLHEFHMMQTEKNMSSTASSTSNEKENYAPAALDEKENCVSATVEASDELSVSENTRVKNGLSFSENTRYKNISSAECQSSNAATQPAKVPNELPKVGDEVHVSSLGTKATVLKVDPLKGEVMLKINRMKLRLKFGEIGLQ